MTIEQDETGRLSDHTREMIRERLFKRLEASEPYETKRVSLRVIMQSQARHLATFVRAIATPTHHLLPRGSLCAHS